MKKKIISLSVAFVLVAIAAIGATFAYLTDDAGSVLNKFAVGALDIDAAEYVNHTNQAGEEKDTDANEETAGTYTDYLKIALDNTNTKTYDYKNILPGDTLSKKVVITNKEASNPAIFAVKVTETLPDDALLSTADWSETTELGNAIPALDTADPTLLGVKKDGNGTYVFYYFMPVDSTQEVDLSTAIPGTVANAALSNYNGKISVYVAAIQAEGFTTTTAAITALEEAVPGVKLVAQTPEQGEENSEGE